MTEPRQPSPDDVPNMRTPDRDKLPPGGFSLDSRPGWKRGDRVLAPWEPVFLYAGTIEKVEEGRALIEFDDGDSGWIEVRHVQPLRYKPGQKLLSRKRMGPHFFPAEIREVNGEDLVIEFDDGQE
jgi:hypothetical protein